MNEKFQGRFGFHPCDRATYLKLKLIHKVFWKSIFRSAQWYRWDRKEPQNRVQRFQRAADGKREKLVPPVALPEPKLPPYLLKLEHRKIHRTYTGDYKQWIDHEREVVWYSLKMNPDLYAAVADYQNARTPVVESQVRPLSCSAEKIEALYQQALEWVS